MPVLRGAHQGGRAGRGDRAGAVRAAGTGAGHLSVAWAVPVLGPGVCGAGRDIRLRAISGCAGRAGPQARRACLPGPRRHHHGPGRGGGGAFRRDRVPVSGKLAWVHSASAGKYVLLAVQPRRGKEGMDAAGVLPAFAGIACHDAWKPYDSYDGVTGHALCNARLLRELTAVTGTGTEDDVIWAQQAIDALLAMKEGAGTARAAGRDAIDPETLGRQSRWFREAAKAGVILNAARRSKLQKKRHALAARMRDRADDYMRFADDLQVPFDNNEAEQVRRMSKLRVKVSGCMRSWTGAETFCAIRSCLATAAGHGIGWLDALTLAAARNPWIPGTT
jgi:transposase